MNRCIYKEVISANLDVIEDIGHVEVGWYWRVMAINRCKGSMKLQRAKVAYVKPSLWARLRGAKPLPVVFV